MKNFLLTALLLCSAGCATQAQTAPPAAAQIYAWYREDGLQTRGKTITAWNNSGGEPKRALNQLVGQPMLTRVKTPTGEKNIALFDGSSALWQRLDQWGEIKGDLTVIALARLTRAGAGFLFDGSTGVGLTRAQVRDNQWQIGAQKLSGSAAGVAGNADVATFPARLNVWQTHVFTFRKDALQATHNVDGASKTIALQAKTPLSGFIVGANGAAKNGLRVQIAELLVYNRALSDDEANDSRKYLQGKWGALEAVANAQNGSADVTAISVKLADKSKPLIWMFSGQSADEKALGGARNQAEHFAERVRWEMNRRRDVVIDTRAPLPGTLEPNLAARVARFRPDIVVLKLNAGDDAAALIEKVRALKAIPILQSDSNQAAWRQIAADYDVLLVETPALDNTAQKERNDTLALLRALNIDDTKSSLHQSREN